MARGVMGKQGFKGSRIPLFWQVVIVVMGAVTMGFAFNQVRTKGIPLVQDWSPEARIASKTGDSMVISLQEARRLCLDKKAVFLDARSEEDYARGHIRCAQNIPWQSFEQYLDRVRAIPEHAWIVTYCDGETCSLSEDLAKELVSMGYENVKVLLNGWTRWVEAGLPVEKGDEGPLDGRKG